MKTFCLPDLGEGLTEGEIVKWHVSEGAAVRADDILVSIETAKAVVEVPSPFTGYVRMLCGKEGEVLPTGAPLVHFESHERATEDSMTVAGDMPVSHEKIQEMPIAVTQGSIIRALPAVRALAKKLQVDLNGVTPSGQGGTITLEDVRQASHWLSQAGSLEPLQGPRRTMALVMTRAHQEVVPVTLTEDADVSAWATGKGLTVRVIQAMVHATQVEPALNAWYDSQTIGRRLLQEVHIGLAMDTEAGLLVPVIRQAQKMVSKQALQETILALKKAAHQRTLTPAQLQGASIVLSNFGKFAGRYANPVVVPPTVAILGVGSLRQAVLPYEGVPQIRWVLPLSLTIDHRAVTGGEAARFLSAVIQHLERAES